MNQVFALFRVNYHNQYYSAYKDDETLKQIKKLWLDSLVGYPPKQILLAAKKAIEDSEYLPTLHKMLSYCESSSHLGLPDEHRAYREACLATSPKADYHWSHLAVYYAGKETGWHFLASEPEAIALPVFSRNYQIIKDRLSNGESLAEPIHKALPEEVSHPLSKAERQQQLSKLRELLKD